jgi:hypothetical protein
MYSIATFVFPVRPNLNLIASIHVFINARLKLKISPILTFGSFMLLQLPKIIALAHSALKAKYRS